ncbi:MAG: hypothetical protein ACI376_02015 [Candidatus Bruticola sp.]
MLFRKYLTQAAAVGLLITAAACTGSTPDGPNPGNIVPGTGIKEVSLFDTEKQVVNTLGEPKTCTKNPFNSSNVIVQYPDKGIEISYLNGVVGSILLYAPGNKDGVAWQTYQGATSEGLWPESNLKTIKSKLGAPLKELPQAVVYPGLWIRLDTKGNVESFSISKDEASQLKNLE